jgi:hypothetical protein
MDTHPHHRSLIVSAAGMTIVALILRFVLLPLMEQSTTTVVQFGIGAVILIIGAVYPLKKAADFIESTTDILSKKTHLAGGFLQSLGTAFPDMILGITAALISLRLRSTDMTSAISYAIIAASTTFGSNIYNIGHAIWCLHRQNHADSTSTKVPMFPGITLGGYVTPIVQQRQKPRIADIDTSVRILTWLTLLTAMVALSMVLFGSFDGSAYGMNGDLYSLIQPVGAGLFLLTVYVLYTFRNASHDREQGEEEESAMESNHTPLWGIWILLLVSGISIACTAESMIYAMKYVSEIMHIPVGITGVLAGVIGCLGEIMVVHNYSVHPNGRLGDALVGVAMDNIVTIMGASIVAVMGGIFLGGTSLIVLFVIILTLNTILISQITKLKNTLIVKNESSR